MLPKNSLIALHGQFGIITQAGKRRLNFANFITKERLNFPAVNRYHLDIIDIMIL